MIYNYWTHIEINYLKNNYNRLTTKEIAIKLNRDYKSVCDKCRFLGLFRYHNKYDYQFWTKKEIDYLKEKYGKLKVDNMKFLLENHSWEGIICKAIRLKLKSDKSLLISGKSNPFFNKYHSKEFKERHSKFQIKRFENPKNHPSYKNGKSKEPYPIDWNNKLKEFIRNRDKKCQICGMSRNVHKKYYKRDLSVHHIDRDKDNLDHINLICLCFYHHLKIQFIQEHLRDYFYYINLEKE